MASSAVRYFVQLDGQINGPYCIEQLRELAIGLVIKPTSLAAATAEGPWLPLSATPEATAIFPPRAAVAFREGGFVAVGDSARPLAVTDLIAAAQTDVPLLRKLTSTAGPIAEPTAPLNDVQQMVRSVQATEAAFAAPLPPPKRKKMSRSLKYVLLLSALLILSLAGIRLGYASRWDDRSTTILLGWGFLGHAFLVALYFLFRKTES